MSQASIGCDVIVNGLNPPNYHNWAKTIPAITQQVIAATKASGATIILPGNVYNFGDKGGTWSETTAQNPTSRKGRIRVEMEQSYKVAGIQTIVLRAGNFLDPNKDGDLFSMVMTKGVAKGRLTRLGGMDVMQTYAYLPDWARAAEQLASKRMELASFEDIPFAGHAFSMADLQGHLERRLGLQFKVSAFPWWIMRMLSPVWELARELSEMRYLNETSHRLDNTKFNRRLPGFQATGLDDVLDACLPAQINPNQSVRTSGQAVRAQ